MRSLSRIVMLLVGVGIVLALGGSATPPATDVAAFANLGGYDCRFSSGGTLPTGVPAIQPHLSGVPAFTKDDARAYVQAQGQVTIIRVLFVTSYEACELMEGELVGLPDDALVCYVELRGNVVPFTGPPGSGPPSQSTPPLEQEVFDARTGNLLVEGVEG